MSITATFSLPIIIHSPLTLRRATCMAMFVRFLSNTLAAGLDPEKATLYIQSDVPEVAELYLFLNMNAYIGELERCTSFKDKIRQQPENVNAGLLTYPTLMAADILIHRANESAGWKRSGTTFGNDAYFR